MQPTVFKTGQFSSPLFIIIIFCLLTSCAGKNPDSPEGFVLADDFWLEQVASEPLIKDPVDLEFDAAGRAFVLQMPGYPQEDKQSYISMLTDRDGDGQYDSSFVYADSLQLASSIMPYREGLLVAAPPYLLHIKDTDGDQRADQRDTLMGGFETGNLQHNFNGLTMGLDGRIYIANGGNSGKPYWWGDSSSVLPMEGKDLVIDLKAKTMELLGESSGGFGLAMDPYGRIFETHNLEHASQLVFPGKYMQDARLTLHHSLSNISDHEENGTSRIYPVGEQETRVNHPEQSGYFSGSCGILHYGGGAYGPDYDHTLLVADVVMNLVHADRLRKEGAAFAATRMMENKELLASADRSFRPVNMTVGPDGLVYILDMHRKVIEHPEWIPDEIESGMDLNAGKDQGRIFRLHRTGRQSRPVIGSENSPADVQALRDPNQWVRMTAHRLLIEKGLSDADEADLHDLAKGTYALGRLHALWQLALAGKIHPQELKKAMQDPDPGIRENALLIIERNPSNPIYAEAVMVALTDSDQRVRMQAALTASIMSQKDSSKLIAALDAAQAMPADRWNYAAITLAARPVASAWLHSRLRNDNPVSDELLRNLTLQLETTKEMESILSSLATSKRSSDRQIVLKALGERQWKTKANTAMVGLLDQLDREATADEMPVLSVLRTQLGLPATAKQLAMSREAINKVLAKGLADSLRLVNLRLVSLLPYNERETLLFACLGKDAAPALQEAALRQLYQQGDPQTGYRIVSIWKELGPHIRRYASDLLIYVEANHDALLTGLEKGTINIGEMNFDLERRRQLLWWTDNLQTRKRAEKLFSDAGVVNRKEAIAAMQPALKLAGKVEAGQQLFTQVCSSCHQYGKIGQSVGPALTEINRKSREAILHEILDPNSAVDTRYIQHKLVTRSGQTHIGIVHAENSRQVVLRQQGGSEVVVERSDIASLTSLGSSLMMEGLENSFTHQQMADLLAFLQKGN
jgi:putative membrane-bound dehydrogenase-like protein